MKAFRTLKYMYSAFMLIKTEFMVILINISGEMDQLNTPQFDNYRQTW